MQSYKCGLLFLPFFSLNIIFSRFIHVVASISILSLFKAKYYSIVWIYHILFIEPSVDGHLCCFHLLAIVNNAAMNICVQVFVWAPVFSSLGCIPRSGFAELHGNHTFIGEPPNCLPQGMHHFTFPPSMKESSNFCFPFPNFHFHQYLFSGVLFVYLFVFVIISFLVGVVLICIS